MKTKIKQTLATILTLTLMLCSLSACGTNPENAITGKWYNGDGECLDIRSDGSYKLEDSYGTGTWKYLDDNETIEFTDIYGDTNETKVEKDDNGEYIKFSSHGVFRKKAEDISENKKPSIIINKTGYFSDGVAWITYNDETGIEQLALIDTNGRIVFKEPTNFEQFPSEMHGISYIYEKDKNYKIINKKGDIIAESQDGTFDSVLACGDGAALVYKFSGPKDSKHLYGVINSEGQFILDYMEFSIKTQAEYLGCGIFALNLWDGYRWALINSNTGSCVYIGAEDRGSMPKFVNNSAYFGKYYYISKKPFEYFRDATKISYFALDTNFNTSTISEFRYSSNGMLIDYKSGYDNPVFIINPKTNDKYTLDYNTTQLIKLKYTDDLGLLTIQASDGNKYFTLLDTQGKEQFEPIKCNSVEFSDGKISYENDNFFTILDTKGNVLAENLEYKTISEFSEDIALATTALGEYCFINSKGEKILQNIHE